MTAPPPPATGVPLRGNDWSVLGDRMPGEPPSVSVIVAHFEQQRQLDRTLAAVALQTHPAALTQVIVVDDGSAEAPAVPTGVLLLRQDDLGFRLSAARNLGAANATGDVLCFLDADTAPEPGYLAELTRLPALAPDVLAVGRRRHADLAGVSAYGDPAVHAPIELAAPRGELPEPDWLRQAYTDSRNLLHSDDRSYRFVIGAVVACSRTLFDATGGFDETFTEYGGEDWEWAHRAWLAGAVFAHIPSAVAWHDGPEWAGRDDDPARLTRKNAETLALARRIPVAGSRPPALRLAGLPRHHPDASEAPPAAGTAATAATTATGNTTPAADVSGAAPVIADIVVRVHSAGSLAALVVSVDTVLAALPESIVAVPSEQLDALAPDARLIPLDHLTSARLLVDVARPVHFDAVELRRAVDRVARDQLGSLELTSPAPGVSTDPAAAPVPASAAAPASASAPARLALISSQRAVARERRWQRDDLFDHLTEQLTASTFIVTEPSLAAHFGGWD